METQLGWLREIGFVDVDRYWNWLEMALLIGYKAISYNTKTINLLVNYIFMVL